MAAGEAIAAAAYLEHFIPWADEDDNEEVWTDEDEDEAAEHATISYKYALRRLAKVYEGYEFGGVSNDSNAVANEDNSKACPCGEHGCLIGAGWPWQLQSYRRGFCSGGCSAIADQREEWLRACTGDAFTGDWWDSPRVAKDMFCKAEGRQHRAYEW